MSIHFLIFSLYTVLAAAGGAALYRLAGFDPALAALSGGGGLSIALLAHVLVTLGRKLYQLREAQAGLAADLAVQSDGLAATRGDLDHFKQATRDASGQQHDRLMAEVRVLQKLLAQVVTQRGGGDQELPLDRGEMSEDEIFHVMHHALEENRVDLYLQPIVQLPSRKVWHYECFSRVRDEYDTVIYPAAFIGVAERRGLAGTLDNLLLFRCMQIIRRLGDKRPGVKFFCNIASASLTDQSFFPSFVEFLLDNKSLANRLVFEFTYEELQQFSAEVLGHLGRLAKAGFAFSVDQVTDLDFDPAVLARRFISFVKIDASVLLFGRGDIHPADLKAVLKRHGMELVITKIEDEPTVVDVLDHEVDYGQGYLFGEPRPSRLDDTA